MIGNNDDNNNYSLGYYITFTYFLALPVINWYYGSVVYNYYLKLKEEKSFYVAGYATPSE